MRGALAFVLAAWVLPAPGAGPLSVEAFFQKEKYGGAMISPSGRYIAVITQWKDRRNVGIIDLESRKSSFASALEEADVLGVRWLNDTRLYVTYGDLQARSGEPPRETGIVASPE